jgi:hypothetical protein
MSMSQTIEPTHCRRGHPYVDGSWYYRTDKKTKAKRCRICDRENQSTPKRKAARARYMMREQTAQLVLLEVQAGHSLTRIIEGKQGDKRVARQIVSRPSFNNYMRAHPDYAKLINKLRKDNKKLWAHVGRPRKLLIAAPSIIKTSDNAFELIERHVSNRLPYNDRMDVIGSMLLAYMEGRLKLKDIPTAADAFRRAHNRAFPSIIVKGDHPSRPLSLDQTVPGTDSLRYIDNVTDGLW